MKKLLISAFFCASIIGAFAQKGVQHRSGELLVYLAQEVTIEGLSAACQRAKGERNAIFTEVEQIVAEYPIYRLFFDENQFDENQLLATIQAQSGVISAQFNHIATSRRSPNDPLFVNQWDMRKIGLEQVWDFTTGGTNALGDSIVVAVAEVGGFNPAHPDIAQNIYRNRKEIANNGKDDDNNGYIDDVMGWNNMDNNGGIPPDSDGHGTPVLGIIGAKGNNSLGVTGVNWNVKMMLLPFVDDEVSTIKAYTYALKARDLYNRTRGKQGAFVVVLNYSAGVDDSPASQSPLWCKMYDEIGKVGILAVAATSNAPGKNIELKGDTPSQCTSQYLIVTTNTDRTDEIAAGCSKISVDIAAPGGGSGPSSPSLPQGSFTTRFNVYDEFRGTSAAAPHVSGTIALLYSFPNQEFATAAIDNPSSTALFIRDAILNGVDKVSELTGCTVTGGRLNANKSYQLLQNAIEVTQVKGITITPSLITSADAQLSIQTNGAATPKTIFIYDAVGRLAQSFDVKTKLFDTNSLFTVDARGFANGVYFLSILNDDGRFITRRFLVCR